MSEPDKCIACGKPATNLCDSVIARKATACLRDDDGSVAQLLSGFDGNGEVVLWTCDAPLCDECAIKVGMYFGEEIDSVDYCSECNKSDTQARVVFEYEVPALRRSIWARPRRSRIKQAEC